MMRLGNQNKYNSYRFSRNSCVFFGAKAENGCLTDTIKKCRYNIFCRIDLFRFSYPVFQHSTIPSFHAAYQENGRKKHRDFNKL